MQQLSQASDCWTLNGIASHLIGGRLSLVGEVLLLPNYSFIKNLPLLDDFHP